MLYLTPCVVSGDVRNRIVAAYNRQLKKIQIHSDGNGRGLCSEALCMIVSELTGSGRRRSKVADLKWLSAAVGLLSRVL